MYVDAWLRFLIDRRDAWPGQLDNVPVNTTMSDIRDIEISATLKLSARLTWLLSLHGSVPTLALRFLIPRIGCSKVRLFGRTGGTKFYGLVAVSILSRVSWYCM